MQPKRGSLPFLFLASFAAIFLYSYHYHYSLHQSQSQPQPQPQPPILHPQNPRNPNPSFTFTIKLLTFDRLPSLRRCLRSLAAADYLGDRAHLHIFVDHFRNASDSVDRDLESSHRILEFVDGFEWRHGEKLVHYRTGNAGLQAQWLEAWWPSSDDEFAFVVEDDVEVSPLYYRFLKGLILKYYYEPENYSPDVYGASLQRPRFVAGKHGNKLQVDGETHLFLYQMVGTWGQLLFPKPWKEFRLWYDVHKAKGIKPILQGMVTTGWYKRLGDKIWTPWFIKFVHSRGYYNIYTNFLQERALSTSHRDPGVNYGKTAGPDSKLLDESSLDFNLWELQPLRNLKWYDFCFSEVLRWRVVKSYSELGSVLGYLQKQKPIVLISLYKTTDRTARNLICLLERLSVPNFVFVGGKTELLHDLARRGYPVIDSDQFINSIQSYKLTGEQSEISLMKEIWVKANVIKRSLELGYDCWMMDGNLVPSTDFFAELPDSSYAVSASKNLELMFVKSSPSSLKIWVDGFVSKIASIGTSLMASNSIPVEQRHFVYFAIKVLENTRTTVVLLFDESMIGVKIGDDDTINQKSLDSSKKFVFWSRKTTEDSVQRDLKKLDMWLIDEDSACISVVCHR